VPEFIPYLVAYGVLGFFGWLRYRAYLEFLFKVVKKHGVEGLRAAEGVAKPGLNIDADLPRKKLPPSKPDEQRAA
jgi:hypothetical protein